MAEFNPIAPEVQSRDFTGYSRGIGTNQAFSSLFSNIADTISGYVQARDEQIQTDIYDETRAAVDEIQAPYIAAVQAADAPAGSAPEGGPMERTHLPPGLQAGANQMTALQAGFDSGVFTEEHYNLQLLQMSKSLRNRYPGYDQQIDGIVRSVTGRDPANAVTAAYFDAIDAAQSAANNRANFDRQLIKEMEQSGILGIIAPDYHENPQNYPIGWLRQENSRIQADQKLLQMDNDRMEFAIQQGNFNKSQAVDYARESVDLVVTNLINGTLNSERDFMTMVDAARSDPAAAPADQIQALLAQAGDIEAGIREQVHDILYGQPLGDGVLADHLSKEQMDDLMERAISPVQDIINSLTNEHYGIAGYDARVQQQRVERQRRVFYDNSPAAQHLKTIRDEFGETALNQALSDHSSILGPMWQQTLSDMGYLGALSGEMTAEEWLADIREAPSTSNVNHPVEGSEERDIVVDTFDRAVDFITDPNSDPDMVANAVDWLYGMEGVLGEEVASFPLLSPFGLAPTWLQDNFQQDDIMFSRLVNEDITQRIFALGDPTVARKYSAWASRQFTGMFTDRVQRVQRGVTSPYLDVSFNPETLQFQMAPTPGNPISEQVVGRPGLVPNFLGLTPVQAYEGLMSADAIEAMQELNRALLSVKGLAEANGLDAPASILGLLHSMGYDPSAPTEDNILGKMGTAVQEFIGDVPSNVRRNLGLEPVEGYPGAQNRNQPVQMDLPPPALGVPNRQTPTPAPLGDQSKIDLEEPVVQLTGFEEPIGSGKVIPEIETRYADRRLPVSIRNNNMGAVSLGNSNSWVENLPGYVGKTPRPKNEGGYYAKFASPEAGVNAASQLLVRYGNRGIDTAEEIVKKWSTDSSAWASYARTISEYTGEPVDVELDLNDPQVRKAVLMAQSAHESGVGKPVYNEEVFDNGVNLGANKTEAADVPTPRLRPTDDEFNNMPLSQQLAVLGDFLNG